MGIPVYTSVPDHITSGETIKLDLSYTDFGANDGWSLKFYYAGPVAGYVTATTSAGRFLVTLAAAVTATMDPGNYTWEARVTKASEAAVADSGAFVVAPNIARATSGSMLSHAERTLAIIIAAIEGRLTTDMQAYQINGRAITKIPIQELVLLRSQYEAEVRARQSPGKVRPKMLIEFTGTDRE